MHILMIGASGLLGEAFRQRFPHFFYTVLQHKRVINVNSNVKVIHSLQELNNDDDIDVVINFAGEPIVDKAWTASQKQRLQQSRWLITEQVSQWINRHPAPSSCYSTPQRRGIWPSF